MKMLNYFAYLNARRLEKNKKWKLAFEAYKKIAKDQKNMPAKLAYRIGFVAEKVKDWKSAEAWLTKAVKEQSDKAQWLYRLAFAQEKNKKYAAAIGSYNKALKINPEKAEWIYRSGLCHELLKKYPAAQACYESALEKQPATAEWQYRLGKVLWLSGQSASAEAPLRKAMELEPQNALYAHELSVAIRKQGRTWQEVEALQHTLALDAGKAQWQFEQGEAQDKMNRFAEAGQAFQEANRLQPGNAMWHYREGYAWERASECKLADSAYAAARSCDKDLKAKIFGVGAFHQHRGLWPQAAVAYENEANLQPFNGELLYRLGMAHDRCYRWEKAADCYKKALVIEPNKPDWHYRLGFVLERQGLLKQAAQAYEYAATTRSTHTPYWFYRLGYVLASAGAYEKACTAFLRTREKDDVADPPVQQAKLPEAQTELSEEYLESLKTNLQNLQVQGFALSCDDQFTAFYKFGNQAARLEMWGDAAAAYTAASERSEDHNTLLYYRLGYVLEKQEKYEEACQAFKKTRILQKPHGVSEELMSKSEDIRTTTSFVEYSQVLPLNSEAILYESFNGNSLTCNPFAIFKELIAHPLYKKYLHVWALNDKKRIPKEYCSLPNVIFLRKGSDGYLRYLATAKYLINNSGFPSYFSRRDDQKYLSTWHGTPLKTLGKEQKYKFYDHKRTQRNFLQSTHIISPNKHTSDIQLDSYDIRPLFDGLYSETGYPRIDLTLNTEDARKECIRGRMGLNKNSPVVLYAPTWRGTLDNVAFDTARLEKDLSILAELDCQVIFRGHSLLERVLDADNVACQVVPEDIDTNELLSIVDVLVTDYSSIFFDFLATGRPVLYYIYDVESYEQERGLYFSMDEMPGIKCKTIEELRFGVVMALRGEEVDIDNYKSSQAIYNYRDDGQATRRVIEFFFENSTECLLEYRKENKPSMLINAGSFQANGITASAINLITEIDKNIYDVILAFSPNAVEYSPEALVQFQKLPSDIYAVPRYGNMPMSLEERWIRKNQESGIIFPDGEAALILESAYSREFRRILGGKKYDAAISFSGYDQFWSSIFFINDFKMKKLVYLHNDMYSEFICKYPSLARMFEIYSYADCLVSVSEQTNQLNKKNLSGWPMLKAEQFVYSENVINAENIFNQYLLDLEVLGDSSFFNDEGPVFINIGRLSMEKDQRKLIMAFAEVSRWNPDAKLLILGDGPLRGDLEVLIGELGLDKTVHILGYRRNPYNYLKSADCFILSSIHEGQPMTLLESLVLEKSIVATDIVGNRSVMEGRGGLLVENSIEGLIKGMEEFISGVVPVKKFDWRIYNQLAIRKFYSCSDDAIIISEDFNKSEQKNDIFSLESSCEL